MGNVPFTTKCLGSIAIVVTILLICAQKNSWICTKGASVEANVKIVVLWILGIGVCIIRQTDHGYHVNVFPELAKTMSVVFIILQMLFLTGCSRYIFYESRKIKYMMSLLAVANIVNWLDTTLLSSAILTESNFTQLTEYANSPCVTLFHGELYFLPLDMEFSILATIIVIGVPLTKNTQNNPIVSSWNHREEELVTTCRHLSLSGKQKLFVTIACIFLNAPFLIYIIAYPTDKAFRRILIFRNEWLLSVIGAKMMILVLIIIAYYYLYKISSVRTQPINLNFNDLALILGSSAVNASGVINFLFQLGLNPSYTFHTWFNMFYIVYQTIFISFIKYIVIRDKNPLLLTRVRMIVLILISYNIVYWVKDSLYFLSFINVNVHSKFIKSLFFLMYPLESFYRFQSAMGMIAFLF